MLALSIGCQSQSQKILAHGSRSTLLQEARLSLDNAEYYRARKLVERALDQDPLDTEAQTLAAEILDAEIARQKEAFDERAPEEYTSSQRSDQAKTWLERAEMLSQIGQHEQAILAAEKVFLYEPENVRASELIDRNRQEIFAQGRGESLQVKQVYEQEVDERVVRYKEQARKWIDAGRFGAARLAIEKILLLRPSDPEAQRLYNQIKDERKVRDL